MIFFAVSMGFIAENIREHITDNEREKEFVKSLVEDLREDQKFFTNINEYFDNRLQMIDSVIQQLNTEFPLRSTRNFYYWSRAITRYSPVIVNTATLDELKYGSNFRLLKKKQLAKKIIEYYNVLPNIKEYESRLSQVDWDYRHTLGEVADGKVLPEMMGINKDLHRLEYDPPLRNATRDNLAKLAYYAHGMLSIRLAVQESLKSMQQKGAVLLQEIEKEYH